MLRTNARPPDPAAAAVKTRLAGWGANVHADCVLVEPETPADIERRLDRSGTIARGLGRSYGDAALNAGGQVLGLRRVDRYLAFDEASGALTCEAGVSLAQIIDDFTPRGWFPSITPGTKFVTVGGCIANDVHGKAHHAQGSFSACVDDMLVLLASGDIVRASRTENADLFWATLRRHGSAGRRHLGHHPPAPDRVDVLPTAVDSGRATSTPCWRRSTRTTRRSPTPSRRSTCSRQGARLGRGVVTVGDHARRDELPARLAAHPLRVSGPPRLDGPLHAARADAEPRSASARSTRSSSAC